MAEHTFGPDEYEDFSFLADGSLVVHLAETPESSESEE